MDEPIPTPFDRVCKALGGNQKGVAAALGLSQPSVHLWKRNGIPEDRCPQIEALTGLRCEELRPDREWLRDADGAVTGWVMPIQQPKAA